jgi:2-polyprenyl-3-methyl-5-hydroxy-6-metoxy-1,4-benzoquinol methylase
LCLETLEHTGNFINALTNLYLSCKVNGLLIISIPNEKGIPGIIKYFGRKLLRRKAYGDFFKNQSELKYFRNLVLNKPIDKFRSQELLMWGPHLGFDWQVFQKHLVTQFIQENKLELLSRQETVMKFGIIYILRKTN